MNQIELGKRIKEARIAKKMTQSEVVGDYITRNMLSQIESGTACPSVKTLQYLAKVLDLPSILLFNTDEQPPKNPDNSSTNAFFDAKAQYKAKNYEKALELLMPLSDESSAFFDEVAALISMTSLELAKLEKSRGEIKSALRLASQAQKYADMGIYSGREIKTASLILADELSELLGK